MNFDAISGLVKSTLKDHYPAREIESMLRLIYDHLFGLTPIQVREYSNHPVDKKKEERIHLVLKELLRYQPIQYIFGKTEFYGCTILVGDGVLIPRPETEEMVDWVIRSMASDRYHILDLCTGSGCMAIVLGKHFHGSKIYASDFSEAALQYARENAKNNNQKVLFFKHDVLAGFLPLKSGSLDLIISNPPYVTEKEKKFMQPNVLQWEPDEALFVPDNDPLLFYRSIAPESYRLLKPGGYVFMEINEAFGRETNALLDEHGFINIELRRDISGKIRMIRAEAPQKTLNDQYGFQRKKI